MSEDKTYNLNSKLSELVGALEVTNNHMAEIMLLSAIKQTLVRDFGAVLDHDDPLGKYQKEVIINQVQVKIDDDKSSDDGWIKWSGGKMPVQEHTLVDVIHRSGDIYRSVHAGHNEAASWRWENGQFDIISYRISK